MAVNDKSPPDVGFYTFSLLSYYTSPAVSDDMVFHPDAEVRPPSRSSTLLLRTSARSLRAHVLTCALACTCCAQIYPARSAQYNPARWAAAGFNANDSRRFCSASLWALSHPNLNVHLRVPGASRIVTLLGEIGSNVTLALGKNASAFTVRQLAGVYAQVMATAQAKATGFLLAGVGGNRTALQAEYWASINRQLPGAPPPPPPSPSPQPPAPPLVAAGGGGSSHQLRYVLLGVCIAVPLAALASLAIFAWRCAASGVLVCCPDRSGQSSSADRHGAQALKLHRLTPAAATPQEEPGAALTWRQRRARGWALDDLVRHRH